MHHPINIENAWHNAVGSKNTLYIVYETLLRHAFLFSDQVPVCSSGVSPYEDFEYKSSYISIICKKIKDLVPHFELEWLLCMKIY